MIYCFVLDEYYENTNNQTYHLLEKEYLQPEKKLEET